MAEEAFAAALSASSFDAKRFVADERVSHSLSYLKRSLSLSHEQLDARVRACLAANLQASSAVRRPKGGAGRVCVTFGACCLPAGGCVKRPLSRCVRARADLLERLGRAHES